MTNEQLHALLLQEEAELKQFHENASAELNYRNGRIKMLVELLAQEDIHEPIDGSVVGE